MKFVFVFVSALVLVAHSNNTPSDEEDSVYEIKSEGGAGYAVQEAGSPQGVFAEEASAVAYDAEEKPRVGSPPEPQRGYATEEPAAERVPGPESGIYVPIVLKVCTNAACANVCRGLGYKYGYCISLDTCWCYN